MSVCRCLELAWLITQISCEVLIQFLNKFDSLLCIGIRSRALTLALIQWDRMLSVTIQKYKPVTASQKFKATSVLCAMLACCCTELHTIMVFSWRQSDTFTACLIFTQINCEGPGKHLSSNSDIPMWRCSLFDWCFIGLYHGAVPRRSTHNHTRRPGRRGSHYPNTSRYYAHQTPADALGYWHLKLLWTCRQTYVRSGGDWVTKKQMVVVWPWRYVERI